MLQRCQKSTTETERREAYKQVYARIIRNKKKSQRDSKSFDEILCREEVEKYKLYPEGVQVVFKTHDYWRQNRRSAYHRHRDHYRLVNDRDAKKLANADWVTREQIRGITGPD